MLGTTSSAHQTVCSAVASGTSRRERPVQPVRSRVTHLVSAAAEASSPATAWELQGSLRDTCCTADLGGAKYA